MGKRSRQRHKRARVAGQALRAEVDALVKEGREAEAKRALLRFASRHPGNEEVLEDLVDLAYETDDTQHLQAAMERLVALRPETPELRLALAGAAGSNHYVATSLQTFRSFLSKWPRHPGAAEARQWVGELEAEVPKQLAKLGVEGEHGRAVMLQHERIQHLMILGLTQQAREAAQALHAAEPQFSAALNHLALAAWMDGDHAEAEAALRKVLATWPGNVHALTGLVRVLLLSGHEEQAREVAERLKASTAPASDRWLTVGLALSYVGDDEGVLWAYEQAKREGSLQEYPRGPQLKHLAAVAALRRGDSQRARHLWELALKQMPGLGPARRNLEALDMPAPLRPVPWAIELEGWLSPEKWSAFRRRVEKEGVESPHLEEQTLEHFPELRHMVPLLLDRGEPAAVHLALALCQVLARDSRVDAALAAELKRFCLGERGHVADRFKAGRALLMAGAVREEELQLWTGQRRQPYGWFAVQLHGELERRHAPGVEGLLERACGLLEQGEGAQAEKLLQGALAVEPDAPDLLYNLSVACLIQGRREESEQLSEETHRRWPDYFFARCSVAQLRVRQGRLEEARELLAPLLARRRLHRSEFAALCAAHMDLLSAEGDREAALVWLDFLANFLPRHSFVGVYARKLGAPPSLFGRVEMVPARAGAR